MPLKREITLIHLDNFMNFYTKIVKFKDYLLQTAQQGIFWNCIMHNNSANTGLSMQYKRIHNKVVTYFESHGMILHG